MLRSINNFIDRRYAQRHGIFGLTLSASRLEMTYILLQKEQILSVESSHKEYACPDELPELIASSRLAQSKAIMCASLSTDLCNYVVFPTASLPKKQNDIEPFILWRYKNLFFHDEKSIDGSDAFAYKTIICPQSEKHYIAVSEAKQEGKILGNLLRHDLFQLAHFMPLQACLSGYLEYFYTSSWQSSVVLFSQDGRLMVMCFFNAELLLYRLLPSSWLANNNTAMLHQELSRIAHHFDVDEKRLIIIGDDITTCFSVADAGYWVVLSPEKNVESLAWITDRNRSSMMTALYHMNKIYG